MKRISIALLVIVIVICTSVYLYLKSFVPDYTGVLTAPGLTASVRIDRNQYAVPSIQASNMGDLYFAWGYANAQDRMFQLEVTRRIAQGRISEFAGEDALKKDLFLRAVGFYEIAGTQIKKMDIEYQDYFQRYVDGINYYLERHGPTLYMKLLGLKKETWTAQDALSIGMMLNWALAYNMSHELLYLKIAQKIGPERLPELLDFSFPDIPTIIDDAGQASDTDRLFFTRLRDFDGLLGCRSASNNWAVDGTRTAHGGTLFASDMHVHDSKLPNDFYLIRVSSGDFMCAGAQIMGVPFIVSGYNNNIAWGMTNGGPDMVDLFRENIDWQKKTSRFQGKDYPLTEKKISIRVKGKGIVEKSVYYAGNRPILTEVFDDLGIDISLDWTAYDGFDCQGFFMINKARNYDEYYRATERIRLSPQNCVYSDREGNIAYRLIGSLPIREEGTGNVIADAEVAGRNWDGNIPHDQYPSIKNPARGYIVTSNNKVVEDYPFYLNGIFAPPYRYANIAAMLKEGRELTVEDMQAMQTDVHSMLAAKLQTIIRNHVDPGDDPRMKTAMNIVADWDGEVGLDSVAASICNTFYVRFVFQTVRDELGDDLAESFTGERYISMERFFHLLETNSAFFDDVSTQPKESVGDIATRAFNETLDILEKASGSAKIKDWQWKRFHFIRYDHFLGAAKFLEPFVSSGPFPFEGDGETNNRGRFLEIAPPFIAVHASAPRIVVRFDPDPKAWMMLITGENEYFMSPHRDDMIDAWRNHQYFCMEESEARYTMTLTAE